MNESVMDNDKSKVDVDFCNTTCVFCSKICLPQDCISVSYRGANGMAICYTHLDSDVDGVFLTFKEIIDPKAKVIIMRFGKEKK